MVAFTGGCEKFGTLHSLPESVTVTKKEGLPVYTSYYSKEDRIGTAEKGKTYRIINGRPAYFEIKLPDEKTGWINASETLSKALQSDEEETVFIIAQQPVPARKKPYDNASKVISLAKPNAFYPRVAIEFSQLMIELPGQKTGWIDIGRPRDKWVVFPQKE